MSALAPLLVTTKSGRSIECGQVRLADRLDESGDRNVVIFTDTGVYTISVGDLAAIRPNAPPPETNLQKLLGGVNHPLIGRLGQPQLEELGGELALLALGQSRGAANVGAG